MSADMEKLAQSFPSLKRAPGVAPFDPAKLEAWACGPVPSSGAAHAARFVLHVWNFRHSWKCGQFDLFAAINVWDEGHAKAFRAWAERPWLA